MLRIKKLSEALGKDVYTSEGDYFTIRLTDGR